VCRKINDKVDNTLGTKADVIAVLGLSKKATVVAELELV